VGGPSALALPTHAALDTAVYKPNHLVALVYHRHTAIDSEVPAASTGVTFSASKNTGQGNGDETTYDNILVTASNQLTLKSGHDTTLQGAQLAGKQVTAEVGTDPFGNGGNLFIATLQDRSSYTSNQESSGFGISLCIPPICYGGSTVSVNAAKQNIDHNYQSAVGQSGIHAGSDGFDIQVKGNTDLKGGAITSSAEQSNNKLSTGSLTFSDLDNHQDTSASSSSISLGNSTSALAQVGTNFMANLAGQVGLPESGSQSSSTQSVISPATVTITGTSTGDTEKDTQSQTNASTLTSRDASSANQSLKNTLTLQDAAKLQQDLKTAQQNQQAAQLVGSVMDHMIGDLAIEKTWAEGSIEKTVLHGLSGLVQASIAGGSLAAGAAAGALNEKLIPLMSDYLESQGVPQFLKDKDGHTIKNPQFADLMKIGSTLLGAGVGALAGGSQNVALGASVALTGTTENYLKHAQWTQLADRLKSCKSEAECTAVRKEFAALSAKQDAELNKACEDINSTACRSQLAEVQAGTLKQKELALAGKLPDYYLAGSDLNASANLITRKAVLADIRSACNKDPSCTAKKQEALVKIASLALDFTPLIGDIKGFVEAETPFDYVLATVGAIGGPAGDSLVKVLREGKAAYKAGDIAAATAKLEEAKTIRNVMDQTAVVPSLSGSISKGKLGNEAIAVQTPAIMRPSIEDIRINGDITGLKTENLVNATLRADPGMVVLDGTKYGSNNGLDHVVQFVDPQTNKLMTMIIDSKQLAKNGTTSLDPKAAGGVMQLSDASIDAVLDRLADLSPAKLAIDSAKDSGTLLKAVAYVDKATGQLKVVPVTVPNPKK